MCELSVEQNHKPKAQPIRAPWRLEPMRPNYTIVMCLKGASGPYADEICTFYNVDDCAPRKAAMLMIKQTHKMFELLTEVVDRADLNAITSPKLRDWFDRAFHVLAKARGEIA